MGRPPRVSAEEVCQIVALHPEPIVTAKDICEEMNMTRRGTVKRLDKLTEEGYLDKKKVSNSGAVYWLTDKGRNTLGAD